MAELFARMEEVAKPGAYAFGPFEMFTSNIPALEEAKYTVTVVATPAPGRSTVTISRANPK